MESKPIVRQLVESAILPRTDTGSVTDDHPLLDTGLIDSMGILELVSQLEHACGVDIDDAELVPENFNSINSIAALVDQKQSRA